MMNITILTTTGTLLGISIVASHLLLRKQELVSLLMPAIVERSLIEPTREAFTRIPSPIKHSVSALLDNAWLVYLFFSMSHQIQSRPFHQMSGLQQSFQIQGAVTICLILHGARFLLLRSNLPLVQYVAPSYSELENA